MSNQVAHPMVKLQTQVRSLIESQVLKPDDHLWKIALLYGDKWTYWKQELEEFGFSTQDAIVELLMVEQWDEE